MKTVGKFFLSIFLFIFFLLALIFTSIKFQVINPTFWTEAFLEDNTYPKLANTLSIALETELEKEGGEIDSQLLDSIITEGNIKKVFEENVTNFLTYVDGSAGELLVYIPLETAPAGFLPKNIALENEMPLENVFQIVGSGDIPFDYSYLSQIGPAVNTAWLVLMAVLLILVVAGISTATPGKRFLHLGLTFMAIAFLVLLVSALVTVVQTNMAKDLVQEGREPAELLLGTVAPPLLSRVVGLWSILAGGLAVLGLILLFLKKPLGNAKK